MRSGLCALGAAGARRVLWGAAWGAWGGECSERLCRRAVGVLGRGPNETVGVLGRGPNETAGAANGTKARRIFALDACAPPRDWAKSHAPWSCKAPGWC